MKKRARTSTQKPSMMNASAVLKVNRTNISASRACSSLVSGVPRLMKLAVGMGRRVARCFWR